MTWMEIVVQGTTPMLWDVIDHVLDGIDVVLGMDNEGNNDFRPS